MKKLFSRATISTALLTVPGIVLAQGGVVGTELGVSGADLEPAITFIINALLALAGLVAAIYLILGGVRYITSQGDEDKAGEAKQTILYAVIGLIVIGLSAAIVNFVVSRVIPA